MGQQEVYDVLKKYKNGTKWLSAREIADKLKTSAGSTITSLKKLRESNVISFKYEKRPTKLGGKKLVYVYRFVR